jgi:hypothetical protein
MAVADHFTGPLRTSPTAKIPGRLVFEEQGQPVSVVELSVRDGASGQQELAIVLGNT